MARIRMLGAAGLAGVAAAALVGCSSQAHRRAASPTPSRPSPAATGTAVTSEGLDRSYSSDGGTFRYPSAWRLSTYSEVSSFSTLVAFLSTDATHDPCVRALGSVSCSSPLNELGPAGVLVSWNIVGFPGQRGIANVPGSPTTIDGRPARQQIKTQVAGGTTCAQMGASEEVDVSVAVSSPNDASDLWEMTACVAGPGAAKAVSTALSVAHSLRLTAPAPS